MQQALGANRPLTWHEQEELFKWYSNRVDAYLDAGHGRCFLKDREVAGIVAGALRFFDGQRYQLRSWVVMPNHVHAVVFPTDGHDLGSILHSWKSFTSHAINKRLPEKVVPFWQEESYDHLVRDDEDLQRCCHYTIVNPVNARLCSRPEDWLWSSAYIDSSRKITGGGTPPEPAGEDARATWLPTKSAFKLLRAEHIAISPPILAASE